MSKLPSDLTLVRLLLTDPQHLEQFVVLLPCQDFVLRWAVADKLVLGVFRFELDGSKHPMTAKR